MTDGNLADNRSLVESLQNQFVEDSHREPHEKETAFHVDGTGTMFTVTSFKRVIFEKLLRKPAFTVTHIHVRTDKGREQTMDSLAAVAETSHSIIGVVGEFPVGAMTIGAPRTSDSHAGIVTEP